MEDGTNGLNPCNAIKSWTIFARKRNEKKKKRKMYLDMPYQKTKLKL